MDDDFHHPPPPPGPASRLLQAVLTPNVLLALFLVPILTIFLTRYLSERPVEKNNGKSGKRVWMLAYWVPFIGHGFDFLWDPIKLMTEARDKSLNGIFSLYLGGTTHNIVSDPGLVKSVMAQKESVVQFKPIAMSVLRSFFGFPKSSEPKYNKSWEELHSLFGYFMKESQLGNVLNPTIRNMEQTIPQMISFTHGDIDLQPWERFAQASFISPTSTEINLCGLLRDLIGHTSVPAMFGRALMEKYPDILHDVYQFDEGMYYLLAGIPAWAPWPPSFRAHMARNKLWDALDDQQRALDALAEGRDPGYSWGDLDDVSEFILKRNEVYRKNGFEVRERGELSVLWPLIINSSLLVYWQLLYILSTPSLLSTILTEIAPYATITRGASIGKISEAPKLSLDHDGLSKHCPHLKSTYFEALRLTSKPWSVRKVKDDVDVLIGKRDEGAEMYRLGRGEYVTMPHELHMKDASYFEAPEQFRPERFITTDENGKVSANIGTARPYGGGPSMCKGRIYAERECLAFVAGILVFWDIEPADKKAGWVIPKQLKMSAVSKPATETRVRIKRRMFEWEK